MSKNLNAKGCGLKNKGSKTHSPAPTCRVENLMLDDDLQAQYTACPKEFLLRPSGRHSKTSSGSRSR